MPASARPPLRVVVDSSGSVPATLHLFDDAAATLVATTDRAPGARIEEWTATGAQVALLDRDADGRVCSTSLAEELGKRDVQGLVFEGGPTLAWSAVREGLIDRIVCYLAPLLVGGVDGSDRAGGIGVRARSVTRFVWGRSRWRPSIRT